jgi:hypothetical protein
MRSWLLLTAATQQNVVGIAEMKLSSWRGRDFLNLPEPFSEISPNRSTMFRNLERACSELVGACSELVGARDRNLSARVIVKN